MIRPEQIPPEVVEAAVAMRDRGGSMSDIIRTALNAWPNAYLGRFPEDDRVIAELILPLPEGDGQ